MILRELRRFFWEENGTEVVEWAIVALILLALTVPTIILVGGQLKLLMCNMLGALGGDTGQCATTTPNP